MSEKLYVIFDGPPSPDGCQFIEVENDQRQSVNTGEWQEDVERMLDPRQDGNASPFFWRLGPFYSVNYLEDLEIAEVKIARLVEAGNSLSTAMESGMSSIVQEAWEVAKR